MSLLDVKDLHASVEGDAGKAILKGLNLQIQAGEVHAIMGPTARENLLSQTFCAGGQDTKSLAARLCSIRTTWPP